MATAADSLGIDLIGKDSDLTPLKAIETCGKSQSFGDA